ncbi:MAG: AsnC family transcriptional regulator [Firmicutes bacterium]|nr:AsnC family transcriptional regulator [Bacillota bacterium]
MTQIAPHNLTTIDRKILNMIQTCFPLVPRPYAAIAEEVGLREDEALARVVALQEAGIIRRIGGIFDSQKLGFSSTLVALTVEEDKIEKVATVVSELPGVTHNYQRQHEFNLWFTLLASSAQELEAILTMVEGLPGVRKLRNLPALKLFKIGVNFNMSEDSNALI